MIISKQIGAVMLLAATASLGACVNPYKGVPLGYAVRGSQVLEPEDIVHQDTVVAPRCAEWAEQTNPSPGKMAVANAWNSLLGGAVGGAAGAGANAVITGGPVSTASIAGAGAYYALPSAILGGVNGWTYAHGAIHGWAKTCVAADAGGLHYVPPSDGQEIVESGEGRTYNRENQPAIDDESDVTATLVMPIQQ